MNISFINIDITPPRKTPLSGFGRRRKSKATVGIVECRLRIAWIKNLQGKDSIFFLADYLYFPDSLATYLKQWLFEKFGVKEEQIIFAATHTHSGPQFDFFKHEKINVEYLKKVQEKCSEALLIISKKFVEVNCATFNFKLTPSYSVNRRKVVSLANKLFLKKESLMLPNLEKNIEEDITGISFYDDSNRKRVLFISYASHPVFNTTGEVSSDYPGQIANILKRNLGYEEVFIFQGFGGDIKANFTKSFPSFKQGIKRGISEIIKLIFYGKMFNDYSYDDFTFFTSSIAHQIEEYLNKDEFRKMIISTKFDEHEKLSVNVKSQTNKTSKDVVLKKIKISDQQKIISASGEIFAKYYTLAKSSNDFIFSIACTDNNIGYLPSYEEIKYGGYEVVNAAFNNFLDSPFSEEEVKKFENKFQKFVNE